MTYEEVVVSYPTFARQIADFADRCGHSTHNIAEVHMTSATRQQLAAFEQGAHLSGAAYTLRMHDRRLLVNIWWPTRLCHQIEGFMHRDLITLPDADMTVLQHLALQSRRLRAVRRKVS